MRPIVLLLLLLLLLPDLYIHLIHLRHLHRRRLWLTLLWAPTLLLLATFTALMLFSGQNTLAHHTHTVGLLAILLFLFGLPKMLFALCSLLGQLCHRLSRSVPRMPFLALGGALAILSFGGILYGTLLGYKRLEVKQISYRSPRLPVGFDGYRIVQLSDIHLGSWDHQPSVIQELVTRVNALHPDLILFTGDLVNQRSTELDPFVPILSQLHARDGVFSILGNHDYGDYYHWPSPEAQHDDRQHLISQQAAMGWQMLNNDHRLLFSHGDSLSLAGVENDGEPPFPQHAQLQQALCGSDSLFTILLSHNPTHWRREVLPQSRVDLTLSGHTHAMQVILFGRSLSPLRYPEWQGFYREGTRALYVNIGIGYVGLPFRFGAWPEITLLTLEKE